MARTRLDQRVVALGLVASRERARARILAGDVTVDGTAVTKAGALVADDAKVLLRVPDHPWVGRGGIKLDHGLRVFGVDPAGATVLDIGASTGGFTDVLLERGAARVVALDVGHGQIDWKLRRDPRVVVIEGANARHLQPADLPADARTFDLVTVDVSFISLRHVWPVIPPLLSSGGAGGRVIALVKPQFEAGRTEVGAGGIVTDPAVHARVIGEVIAAAHQVGLRHVQTEPSPITGAEGNREFLVLLALVAPADL
jgi:23S rRNA (cytidine1920-2'-O)/16S rRNA (cytidine1409-2'-O)-methyltransferase